jgi:HK97 family phage major capsid protein
MTEDTRKRKLSFSSEHPYERWFGTEILDHNPKSIRMDFMKSGKAPLLMGHDARLVIGVIEKASIDSKDKMGRADVRFSRSAFASEKLADVDDGILVNVSTGYRVHEMVLEKQSDSGDTYRVTDWEPLEASLVGIPADPTVGVGRSADPSDGHGLVADIDPKATGEEIVAALQADLKERAALKAAEPRISIPAQPAIPQETLMSKENAAAGESAEKPITAVAAENERRDAIIALCKGNKLDSRVEARWIADGTPLSTVAKELLDVLEARGKQKPTTAADLGLSRNETQKYSLFRAMRHLRYGGINAEFTREAAFELECSSALAKQLNRGHSTSVLVPGEVLSRPLDAATLNGRAMATAPGSKGGYMVNVENGGFIEILRNRSICTQMGSRTISGLTGNVMFPRQTGKPAVTWQGGEGTSVTAADQTLGQLSMTPKTAIVITDVSEQLLRQASPSAEQFIMADLAADIAIDGVDNAAINGTGGAQPLGIKNTTGITSGQDSGTATYAKILAFISAAGAVNAIRGNPGFVTNITGAVTLMQRQRFTSTDSPLWEGNALDGSLVKFNAKSSEQLASGNLIFGSWDELVIGDWGVLELSTDTGGTRFNQAQVGIRALWMVDVLLRYPQAFVVSTNLS